MNLGSRLAGHWHTADAAELFREAIRLRPTLAAAHDNLGAALLAQGDAAGALACHDRAIALRPMETNAHAHRGKALLELKRPPAEAIASLAQAIRLKPDHADANADLARALQQQMRADESVEPLRRAVELRPHDSALHSGLLFVLNHVVGDDPADLPGLLAAHVAWAERHARPLYPAEPPAFPNDRAPDRRPLRVGYLSPDLRDHACARFIEPLLAGHDPAGVELVVYNDAAEPDAVTERLKGHVAAHPAWRWRDVAGVGDPHLAWMVREEDRIDVLVDLAGHTSGHRLRLLARRVAPVQATYMGYPNTTGLATVDWRITDAHADPPGATEAYHTERLFRLEGCGYSFQPPVGPPEVSALPALGSGEVMFGCLNRPMKLNARVARLWAELVRAVPGSRLLVLNEHGPAVGELFARAGMPAGRLLVARPRPTHDYLSLYHGIDVALDPFPYGGMTTTCDALWMGVPVVTLAGPAAPSRAGVSLLHGVGHPEWVATIARKYVSIAASLASDLPRLADLRRTLRQRMAASPLCAGPGLARALEAAYRDMWRAWCGGAGSGARWRIRVQAFKTRPAARSCPCRATGR